VARTTVESLQAASEPVAELLEDDDKAHAIITHVSAGLEAGAELIRVWENTESTPSGWQSWCTSILTSIAAVLDYGMSFGIDIPEVSCGWYLGLWVQCWQLHWLGQLWGSQMKRRHKLLTLLNGLLLSFWVATLLLMLLVGLDLASCLGLIQLGR
jgi:hypothetical protein